MWFTRISLNNPVFATMMMLAIVVLGWAGYQRLQVDQFPSIDFPVVVVVTNYEGAAPEIVESEVSKKLEEGLNSIAGISSITSRSYEGTSVVILEFNLNVEPRKAAEDVRERVALIKPSLREEVSEPRVQRFDPSARAIWSVAVLPTGEAARKMNAVELTNWATQVLKRRLENVQGVGAVNVLGGSAREINIYLDPVQMEALGISAEQIIAAIRSDNQDIPIGALKTAQTENVVQIQARLKRPEDFQRIIVARRSGVPIYLEQLARVVDGAAEVESLALYNGQRALVLSVQKAQDENTIAVVDGLNQALKELEALPATRGQAAKASQIPDGVKLEPIADNSRPIRVAVNNVTRTLIEGAVLTVLVILLYLNSWRSTIITGLTLPISIIGTFLFMYVFGFTLNMITLMALSLAVGFLIDDAIVVRENIVRHLQMGKSAMQAASDGTQEIGLAVLATTLTIVAVFLPIGFMEGIIGKFFHQFGITIVAAVLISMFVSFTLDPMMSSVWHDPAIDQELREQKGEAFTPTTWYDKTIGRACRWFIHQNDRLGHWYQKVLVLALAHKRSTVVAALATFFLSLFLFRFVGTEFVPRADFSESYINFYTPTGTALETTEQRAKQVEKILREFPEVRYTLTTINSGQASGKNYASVYVRLVDRNERSLDVTAMSQELRKRLERVPGVTVTQAGLTDAVGGNKQIEFSLRGPDQNQLNRIANEVLTRMGSVDGAVDIDSSLKAGKPIYRLEVKRDVASDLGLSVAAVGNALRTLVAGRTVGTWLAPDDQTYNVNLRLTPSARQHPDDLARLPLSLVAADGSVRSVRVNQVADIVPSLAPVEIKRRALMREVAISANTFGRSVGEVSADIKKIVSEVSLPTGYSFEFGGSTKNMSESFGYALSALGLAIVFIYMVLASQFKSFLQPLALMAALPLTLIGVVVILLVFRSSLSMFTVIGIIMLMGLATKNAILLVDYAIRLQASGWAREAALIEAAKVRLRPILMTSVSLVLGMLPLALALTEGSEQRAPMGQAVIGGVITSSILTLVVVPVVYCYLDDLSKWFKARRRTLSIQS